MAAPILTLVSTEASRRWNRWHYKLVPNTDNYATGGITVDFTAAVIAKGAAHAVPDYPPTKSQVIMQNSGAGYPADFVPNATPTLKNAKVVLYSAAGTELAAGAMPAALQTAEIDFTVSMPRGKSQ